MNHKYFFALFLLFLFPLFSYSQKNIPYLSFGLHGGIIAVDVKPTNEYYSSINPVLECEFAVNINKSFAGVFCFDMGNIRKKEFYNDKTYLSHYKLYCLGFRYTYNFNNKFGIFGQTQIGAGTQRSLDKTPSNEFNFGDIAADISIGLGAKYSITKSLEISTKAKWHGKLFFSFFGGLNFNLPAIKI